MTHLVPSSTPSAALRSPAVLEDQLAGPRRMFLLALALLLASALPDAMTVPVLKELVATRHGVSDAAAHFFMSINLLGGLLAVPMLSRVRRWLSPATIVVAAAAADGLLLLAMAAPVGYGVTLGIRLIEGMADLLVFAVVFDLIGKAGPVEARGRRLGMASSVLMLGLCLGMVLGGRIGAGEPTRVFVAGAVANLLVIAMALSSPRSLNFLIRSCPVIASDGRAIVGSKPLWPALAMGFSDRAIAGLMTTSLPMFFASVCGYSPAQRGMLVASPLLVMAVGAPVAGWLADRVGPGRLRVFAAAGYAASLGGIAMAAQAGFAPMLTACTALGFFGAALLPTSLSLAAASGRGSVAMGLHRTAGDLGYLCGILGATAALATLPGVVPSATAYAVLLIAFAAVHAIVTITTSMASNAQKPLQEPDFSGEFTYNRA
jgi:hypothetical protein